MTRAKFMDILGSLCALGVLFQFFYILELKNHIIAVEARSKAYKETLAGVRQEVSQARQEAQISLGDAVTCREDFRRYMRLQGGTGGVRPAKNVPPKNLEKSGEASTK